MNAAGTAPAPEHPVLRLCAATAAVAGTGWATPEHHADRLRSVLGGRIERGTGFGGPWPLVVVGVGTIAAPGLPVLVGPDAVDGPDATYDRDEHTVWRETAAGRRPLLRLGEPSIEDHDSTQLLWFGDTTRWRAGGRVLEIEDGFSRVTLPATANRLVHVLIRQRRVADEVLEGVDVAEAGSEAARVEVWRDRRLVPDDVTRDPMPMMCGRPEIERLEVRGDRLEGESADGAPLELAVTRRAGGWTVERLVGTLPFSSLDLAWGPDRVRLAAGIDAAVDCLAPGMRQRLVFDLYSDLVAAGRGQNE